MGLGSDDGVCVALGVVAAGFLLLSSFVSCSFARWVGWVGSCVEYEDCAG